MPRLEFEACRERIYRAKTHRETIAKMWRDYATEEQPYSVGVSVDDDGTGSITVEPVYARGFAIALSLQLGEMLYQLRAALDSCIYGARALESGKNPPPDEDKLEFPICKKPREFRTFDRAPLAQKRRAILQSVQPYNVPKLSPDEMVFDFSRTLGILNDWARIDRHRRLHLVGSWVAAASPQIICPPGTRLSYLRASGCGFLEHENVVATFHLIGFTKGMDVKANPDVSIDIALDEPPPPCADNDTLGNRLLNMLEAVEWVVCSIEKSF